MDKGIKSESESDELLPNAEDSICDVTKPLQLQIKSEAPNCSDTEVEMLLAAQNTEISCIESFELEVKSGVLVHECDIKCEDYFNSELLTEEIDIKTESIDNHQNQSLIKPKDVKSFQCNICDATFKQKSNLKTHIKRHSGEKLFQCIICDRKFTAKGTLKRHLRTHTGEKPFQCNICYAKFTQNGSLKKHIKTHTGEKLFQCNICGAKCTQKGHYLQIHARTHTEVKPFQCNICDAKFTQKGHLYRHLQTHMDEIDELLLNTDDSIRDVTKPLDLEIKSETLHCSNTEEELFLAAHNKEVSCTESLELEAKSETLDHEYGDYF